LAGSRSKGLGKEAEFPLAGEAAAAEKRNGCLRMEAEWSPEGAAESLAAARKRATTLY